MERYSEIFLKNEFRAILGIRKVNLWIIFIVFLITTGSLSFSKAGMDFLSQKMEDPFINWIDISSQPNLDELYILLTDSSLKKQFGYSTVEKNSHILNYVFNKDMRYFRVEGRTIESNSLLLSRITDPKNTIVKRSTTMEVNDIGWIVSADLMKRIGYAKPEEYPLFVLYAYPGDSVNLHGLGIRNNKYYHEVPIPIIAVVKQLPDNLDLVSTPFFFDQYNDQSVPFNVSMHPEYFDRIQFVVDPTKENFLKDEINLKFEQRNIDYIWEEPKDFYESFKDARLLSLILYDTIISKADVNSLTYDVLERFPDKSVERYYDYRFGVGDFKLPTTYISIMFNDLANIRGFQSWVKDNTKINIDMAQIEAKENFKTFQILATFLSLALTVISVLFIVIFLYFLINAHFQKISKNLGTIMAFGLDNATIMKIYLNVYMRLILTGLVPAVILLLIVQYGLEVIGITRENGMPFINLFDYFILFALLVVNVLAGIVTFFIMRNKLKSTPGDLIYERNK